MNQSSNSLFPDSPARDRRLTIRRIIHAIFMVPLAITVIMFAFYAIFIGIVALSGQPAISSIISSEFLFAIAFGFATYGVKHAMTAIDTRWEEILSHTDDTWGISQLPFDTSKAMEVTSITFAVACCFSAAILGDTPFIDIVSNIIGFIMSASIVASAILSVLFYFAYSFLQRQWE